VCFILQTLKSSTCAKLHYVMIRLNEVTMEFIIMFTLYAEWKAKINCLKHQKRVCLLRLDYQLNIERSSNS
jgi:hypothetical protein